MAAESELSMGSMAKLARAVDRYYSRTERPIADQMDRAIKKMRRQPELGFDPKTTVSATTYRWMKSRGMTR